MVQVALPRPVPYVTYSIIGITVLFYMLQVGSVLVFGYANAPAQMDWLEYYGAQISQLIRAGELWRFLTPLLLHASPLHIGLNMYAVFVLGPGLERSFGRWRYLALYLLAGFAGNVLSFLLTTGYAIGASTAIFGLIGAEGVFLFQNRKLLGRQYGPAIGNVIFIVVFNLFLLDRLPGIDIWGHVGGLLGGLIFAWFAGPIWEVQGFANAPYVADKRQPGSVVTGAAVVIIIFGALAVWGMIAPLAR